MRPIHWLFVLSVTLFVAGIGFVIAAERTRRAVPPAPAAAAPAPAAVANVHHLMKGVVQPAAVVVWDSVSMVWGGGGVTEKSPKTAAEWDTVTTSAALLVESANLLLAKERAVDGDEWPKMAAAMAASSQKALDAAKAKNPAGIFEVGEEIYATCNTCHERYRRN